MLRTVAVVTFPLVITLWAYAAQPSTAQTVTDGSADRILAQADAGRRKIEPGDVVVVVADGAKLMMGQEVVAALEAGTELPVNRIDGSWVGSQIVVGGEKRSGWIKLSDVKPLPTTAAAPATTESSADAPAESPDENTADAPQDNGAPAEPPASFDIDVIVILSDAEVAAIDRSDRINKLKLTGPGVSNSVLKDLHELGLVNLLSIESTRITNSGLGLLKDATNVRSLRLWQRGFDDSALKQVKKMTALESLDLEGTGISGEELEQLKDLTRLRTLVLGPATEDAQMEILGDLPGLEELDLRCCRSVSDAGVAHLGGLTKLKIVWLPQQVTDRGEIQLMQKLPNCIIQR